MRNIFAAAALAVSITTAHAEQWMVYGLGTQTCQVALTHDWMNNGEFAWVAGFMSSSAFGATKHEMLPGKSTGDLVAIVYNQCKAKPFDTLADVAGEIVVRLWTAQKPVLSNAPRGAEKF